MRDYMVCWRGDLDNGFQEDFFVAGSNPIYTYNLVRADNMYDAVDIFLENTLDYAYNDEPVFLDDVKEQAIEEFVYLICDEDEPNHIIPKRFSTVAKDIFNKYVEECEKRVGRDEAVTDKVDFECRTAVINSLTSKESAKRKYTKGFYTLGLLKFCRLFSMLLARCFRFVSSGNGERIQRCNLIMRKFYYYIMD